MAYYGPKTVNEKGDTVYYSVPDEVFDWGNIVVVPSRDVKTGVVDTFLTSDLYSKIDTTKFPVYIILFLNDSLQKNGFKLEAFFDYVQYKPTEFKDIPMFFVSDIYSIKCDSMHLGYKQHGTFDSLKINPPNFYPLVVDNKIAEENYFKNKPYYVFNYFAVLVDKHRHIRGYYDPNQNSEVKRMIQEYKHLKTKDEYANTLKKNDLKQK